MEIPRETEHTKELDAENGNELWQDAMDKDMKNVGVALKSWKQMRRHHQDGQKSLDSGM